MPSTGRGSSTGNKKGRPDGRPFSFWRAMPADTAGAYFFGGFPSFFLAFGLFCGLLACLCSCGAGFAPVVL